MDILVTSESTENGLRSFTMICGKKEAYVGYHSGMQMISVCCKNASHKVWQGMGRTFWGGWEEAINAYKSSEMRSMIRHARDECGILRKV